MHAVIYRLRNTITGGIYIGSTADRDRREREHRYMLESGRHHCRPLLKAWRQWGSVAFVFEILEEPDVAICGQDKGKIAVLLAEREQEYLDRVPSGLRYNLMHLTGVMPSRLGVGVSEDTRRRMADAHRGKIPANIDQLRIINIGRPCSPETKAKISAAQKGKPRNPESIAKAAATRKGWVPSAEWREKFRIIHTGRKRPAEVGQKISAAKMGHLVSAETRAKISAAKTGVKYTQEQRRRNSESKIGRPKDPLTNLPARSGIRGIRYVAGVPKPWMARIMIGGVRVYLGYFATVDDAVAAQRQAQTPQIQSELKTAVQQAVAKK